MPRRGAFNSWDLMMIDYFWVPWLRELSTKIAEKGEEYLVKKAKAVKWTSDDMTLFRHGDKNIDPLSFLYTLARDSKDKFNFELRSVHEIFNIESDYPDPDSGYSLPYIPRPPGMNTLFHKKGEGDPDLLWRLFRQAAEEKPAVQADDFDAALNISGVGMRKLTQTLFIVNPCYFLPADESNKALPWPEYCKDVENYGEYIARMEAIKSKFPGCEPYEINTFLYEQLKGQFITSGTEFFQISTNVYEDGKSYWECTDDLDDGVWTFKEYNCVYTGGPGEGKKKPLKEPKRGDIILVRKGQYQGYAIGVVEENGYASSGWTEEAVIYVQWINKISSHIDLDSKQLIGFSKAGKTRKKFRVAEAYKVSFDLIERLQSGNKASSQSGGETISETKEVASTDDGRTVSHSLNTILFGPPGTGKTWETTSHAVAIIDGEAPSQLADPAARTVVKKRFEELREQQQIEFVTFHQSYAYEDFIEGIRPDLGTGELTYKLHKGIFKQICERACEDPDNKYVLIIDEVNRGDIAKIFGELITLIEPSKRLGEKDEARVTLPYSQEPFGVPSNLYILGTMNTADRGIALLDTALRRRFIFIEKMPKPESELVKKDIGGVDGQELLKAVNRRIRVKLGREHQIGHTYLIGKTTIEGLAEAFQHQIMPLLQEYFYDDWKKIRFVLNRNPFVREEPSLAGEGDPDRPLLELLPHDDEQWQTADSYQQIYAADEGESSD